MAAPAQPPPPSVSAILEQLDELESLMRRMLTVPVEPPEDNTRPADSSPAPQAAATPGVFAEPDRQEMAARNEEQPEAARPRAESPPAPRRSVMMTPARLPWTPPAAFPERPHLPAPRVLVGFDRGFERLTHLLGPAGGWLRGEDARALLGGLGLLLLAGALSWGAWDWWRSRAASGETPHLAPARQER